MCVLGSAGSAVSRDGSRGDSRRILHVVNRLDDRQGGALVAAMEIANAHVARGHQVSLIGTSHPSDARTSLSSLDSRVVVHTVPRGRIMGRFNGSNELRRSLRQHFNAHDVVHVHSLWGLPSIMSAFFARRSRVRLIVSPHGSLDPYDLQKHRSAKRLLGPVLVRPVLQQADLVLCTSSRESRELETYGVRTRNSVLPLPVADPPSQARHDGSIRQRYGIPATAPLLLFLGRLDRKKGLPVTLEAFRILGNPQAYLLIAGEGTPGFESQIKRMVPESLRERVVFTGWLSGESKWSALRGADLLVLLSDNENFGISVVEAIKSGLPALLTDDVYIAGDLAEAGAARICSQDAAVAAAALESLLSHPAGLEGMAQAARECAATVFDNEAIYDSLDATLRA